MVVFPSALTAQSAEGRGAGTGRKPFPRMSQRCPGPLRTPRQELPDSGWSFHHPRPRAFQPGTRAGDQASRLGSARRQVGLEP